MRSTYFVASLSIVLALGACGTPTDAQRPPAAPTVSEPTQPANPTAEVTSVELTTYVDGEHGFELDYPVGWSVVPDTQVGVRGSQALLLSPGTTPESIVEGGSRLSITIYDWDPKGDLVAYVAQRRGAWEASGFKILDGSVTQLMDARPASDFFIEAPDGVLAYFLLTTNGDQYVQLAGEGDLTLLETIARTLRPIGFQPN